MAGARVANLWGVAQVEEQRLTRERRARAMAHAQLHSGDVASARQARLAARLCHLRAHGNT